MRSFAATWRAWRPSLPPHLVLRRRPWRLRSTPMGGVAGCHRGEPRRDHRGQHRRRGAGRRSSSPTRRCPWRRLHRLPTRSSMTPRSDWRCLTRTTPGSTSRWWTRPGSRRRCSQLAGLSSRPSSPTMPRTGEEHIADMENDRPQQMTRHRRSLSPTWRRWRPDRCPGRRLRHRPRRSHRCHLRRVFSRRCRH